MKIYKNGMAREKIDKDIERLLRIWNSPSPSTEEIVSFFRLSIEYPNVQLIKVRE